MADKKYKITSNYVFKSQNGAVKNLTTNASEAIKGTKGSKCELIDKKTVDSFTVCKINTTIDGKDYKNVFVRKGNIELLEEYKSDYINNRIYSSATVLYCSNAFSQVFDVISMPQQEQPTIVEQKVGRNDPCPCGSGKKYKHCCGA